MNADDVIDASDLVMRLRGAREIKDAVEQDGYALMILAKLDGEIADTEIAIPGELEQEVLTHIIKHLEERLANLGITEA